MLASSYLNLSLRPSKALRGHKIKRNRPAAKYEDWKRGTEFRRSTRKVLLRPLLLKIEFETALSSTINHAGDLVGLLVLRIFHLVRGGPGRDAAQPTSFRPTAASSSSSAATAARSCPAATTASCATSAATPASSPSIAPSTSTVRVHRQTTVVHVLLCSPLPCSASGVWFRFRGVKVCSRSSGSCVAETR
jgi:hypothetical protein